MIRCIVFLQVITIALITGCKSVGPKQVIYSEREQRELMFHFMEGMRFVMVEDYRRAVLYFKKACEVDPTSSASYYMVAHCLAKDNPQDAVVYVRKAIQLDSKNNEYYLLAADIYRQLNQYKEAIKMYEYLTEHTLDPGMVYFQLASMYLLQSNYQQALHYYNEAELKMGVVENITRQKQSIYIYLNQYENAIKEGEKLIKEFPDEPSFHIHQVELFWIANKKTEARYLLQKMQDDFPDEPSIALFAWELYSEDGDQRSADAQVVKIFNHSDVDINQKLNLLYKYIEPKSGSSVQKDSALVFQLADQLVKTYPQDASVYAVYGDLFYHKKKPTQALDYYKRSLKLSESNYVIWKNSILIELELGHVDTALVYAEKASGIFPTQPEVWYLAGLSTYLSKKYKESIAYLEESKKMSMSNQKLVNQINILLGESYYYLRMYDQSDHAFEEFLKQDPDNEHVLNNYSYFLSLRKEKLDKAKAMSLKLIQKYPDNSTYLDTYAWVLYNLKDYQQALIYMKKAVVNTTDGAVLEHYGDILFQLGKKEEALEQWKKAKLAGEASDVIDKKITDQKLYD